MENVWKKITAPTLNRLDTTGPWSLSKKEKLHTFDTCTKIILNNTLSSNIRLFLNPLQSG